VGVVGCSWSHNRQFLKRLEVAGIERIDAVNIVGLHGGHDLQVEHVAARHGAALQQGEQPCDGLLRRGQHIQARLGEQIRNQQYGVSRRRWHATRRGLVMTE